MHDDVASHCEMKKTKMISKSQKLKESWHVNKQREKTIRGPGRVRSKGAILRASIYCSILEFAQLFQYE
jgi:hypothetical protein